MRLCSLIGSSGLDQSGRTKGELWQIYEALFTAIRGLVGKWLDHQVRLEACSIQPFLHHPDSPEGGLGVKVAVHSHYV